MPESRKRKKPMKRKPPTKVERPPRRTLGDMLIENFGSAMPPASVMRCSYCKSKIDGKCGGNPEYTPNQVVDCMRDKAYATTPPEDLKHLH